VSVGEETNPTSNAEKPDNKVVPPAGEVNKADEALGRGAEGANWRQIYGFKLTKPGPATVVLEDERAAEFNNPQPQEPGTEPLEAFNDIKASEINEEVEEQQRQQTEEAKEDAATSVKEVVQAEPEAVVNEARAIEEECAEEAIQVILASLFCKDFACLELTASIVTRLSRRVLLPPRLGRIRQSSYKLAERPEVRT